MQVTFVEPYFDEWENKERATVFDRSFNVHKSFKIKFLSCHKYVMLFSDWFY